MENRTGLAIEKTALSFSSAGSAKIWECYSSTLILSTPRFPSISLTVK